MRRERFREDQIAILNMASIVYCIILIVHAINSCMYSGADLMGGGG